MDIKISPAKLKGKLQAVSSKSFSHRLFIASALSENPTEIYMKNGSSDLNVTFEVLKNFGFRVFKEGNVYKVTPKSQTTADKLSVDVRDSLATLRFLLPVACALTDQVTFDGEGKLLLREYTDLLYALRGVGFTSEKLPFTIKGRLKAGEYRIAESCSMQFVSGLMFALPLLKEDSQIIFIGKPNVTNCDITASVMAQFKVVVQKTEQGYFIKGNQKYIAPEKLNVEGDYALSSAWQLANCLGANIEMENLNPNTLQTEKKQFDLIDGLFKTKGVIDNVDLDVLPYVAVGACLKDGKTVINFKSKISNKELIKVNALIFALNKLGANVVGQEQGLVCQSNGKLAGGAMIDCYGDFRLAMALSIAGCFAQNPIKILDVQTVLKHYATFFNDINALGGSTQVE